MSTSDEEQEGWRAMKGDELSRKMREILGPEWCAHTEPSVVCGGCLPLHGLRHACDLLIEPSPAVAYALAAKVDAYKVDATRNADGWTCAAIEKNEWVFHWSYAKGRSRAEAECRALVALAQRKEAA